MHVRTAFAPALALACSLALAACQPAGKDASGQPAGTVAKALDEAGKGLQQASREMDDAQKDIDKARQEMATGNLSLNRDSSSRDLPKAEITPAGELLIDGKALQTTPEQKQLVLAYRQQLVDIASAGMAIGMEGAKLGLDAAASALRSVASGGSADEVGKQAEQTAKQRIQPQVQKLCNRLPELLKAQQALADALPAFRPYARMTEADTKDCMDKSDWDF